MFRPLIIAVLIIFILAIGAQIYFLSKKGSDLNSELSRLKDRTAAVNNENSDLESQINYFSRWENLEKELKSKFNYKKPDEKIMIITP